VRLLQFWVVLNSSMCRVPDSGPDKYIHYFVVDLSPDLVPRILGSDISRNL
jgi:hypothetical protein